MLTLILGADRAALTDHIFQTVSANAGCGMEGQVLIVPEQFSHEAERRLCETGGDHISRYAEVLSMSRLSDRVAASCGGAARAYLDKGGQLLTMAFAAEQIASRIKLYAGVLRKPEFLSDAVRMVEEFRSYCLEPSVLLGASKREEGLFAQKLEELGLLYEAYLAVCENGKADPTDKLLRLRDMLAETDWAAERTFYLDGFSDFTGAELGIIEVLLRGSRDISIALAAGNDRNPTTRLAWQTASELRKLAEKWGVTCQVRRFETLHPRADTVQILLDGLFGKEVIKEVVSDRVSLCSFGSVEAECRGAVLRVKRLVTQGVLCKDISIVCTDMNKYKMLLCAAFSRAGLPVYYAGENDILKKPVISSILNSLAAAVSALEYEDVALYLKSGLPLVEQDACDRLDDYAYRWNVHGGQWEKSWEEHPRGFGESWMEQDKEYLSVLNTYRETALGPLVHLRKKLLRAEKTGDMVLALSDFLEELHLQERLEKKSALAVQNGQGQLAQELWQLYEIILQSLEQMWLILGDAAHSPEAFVKLYRLLLTQYRVGTIPAGIDQVHVSDLPDLRYQTTKHLFVLGASDGSFPSYKLAEGLLTEQERKRLADQGVSIAPSRADQMDQEMGRIAAALSAAEEGIYLSYCGEQPAWLFRRAASLFPTSVHAGNEDVFLDISGLAAWRLRHGDRSEWNIPELERMEAGLQTLRAYRFGDLEKETVRGLYGKQLYLSASRIEKYASCRFAFFLAYGLKAQPRKKAQMDPSVFGTFVHAVLEQVVSRVMEAGGFRNISEEALLQTALEEIDGYAQSCFPEQAQRSAYLFRRSQAEILDIVMDLGEELRSSLFQPAACELEFSPGGELPPIEIQGSEAVCRISGFVDRVDLYETGGTTYVRVVDYKTGKKDFDYTDILNGAGLQMLVYLFALRQFGGGYFQRAELEPAGVLYLPARKTYSLTPPMPDDELVRQGHREERRRKGLIRSDQQVLAAMEQDPEAPRFMPYGVGKSGLKGDLADRRQMILLERHVIRTLADMADQIAAGGVRPNPVVRGQYGSCRFCDFSTVCHRDLCEHEDRILAATSAEQFWEKLEQEERENG